MLDQRRGRDRHEHSAAIIEAIEPDVDDADRRTAIEMALSDLPADQREVVHMKVYEQRTFQQIADELNVSINTVVPAGIATHWRSLRWRWRPLDATRTTMEDPRDDIERMCSCDIARPPRPAGPAERAVLSQGETAEQPLRIWPLWAYRVTGASGPRC